MTMTEDNVAVWTETSRSRELPTIFFVSGGHKSGTSWLSWMLGSHPEVLCEGAGRFVGWAHSVDAWFNEGRFRNWANYPTVQDRWMRNVDVDQAIRDAKRAMIESILRRKVEPHHRAVGDKTPMFYCRAIERLYELFPDAKFINVIRDGRDVAVSHLFHILRRNETEYFENEHEAESRRRFHIDGEGAAISLFSRKSLRLVALNWVESMRGGQRAKELFGSNYLEIRYEDMLLDAMVIRKAFRLLGVSDDERIARECVERHRFEVRSGGRAPGEADPGAFIRKGISGDWRHYFDDSHKAQFNRLAGDVLIELGYEADANW